MKMKRLQISIQGQVQGVGFRPYVYRIAKLLQLTGWIKNNAVGVLLEIQGILADQFVSYLKVNLPPLAKIKYIQLKTVPAKTNENTFNIIESEQGKSNTIISPDTCICSECLKELFDPLSHYFRYPFLNCTQCGPRFTITQNLPYDRCNTSMDAFPLCQQCEADYQNPDNRRYHAQPTACTHCGPQLSLSIEEIAQFLLHGEIIALKGLGGYQLLCDASNETAVFKLRERKKRDKKPFALMLANSTSVAGIAELSKQSRALLESRERPIVLLKKKIELAGVAPNLNHFGIMLPYTPLHFLLFNAFAGNKNGCDWLDEYQPMILVVTSANLGGDPLIKEDISAAHELRTIADKIVTYNREIIMRIDDSVMCLIHDAPLHVRRARGFLPVPIQLPYAIPPTLAVGGHLKNTFCITRGDEAFVSQHIGSLNNKATIGFFHESLNHLLGFLNVKPERIAHDLHPDFYTTRFARSYGIPAFAIQHHHAHLASVIAEHGIQKQVLGLALDGYGYGLNGEAWGGELLLLNHDSFVRLGSFQPLLQPGGDIAAREPWRMGASVLHFLGRSKEIVKRFPNCPQANLIHQLLDKKINSPSTSSCGRLFDAASALLGVQLISQYEGHAAMQLESLVTHLHIIPNGWQMNDHYFDMMPTLEQLLDLNNSIMGANLFHGTLIAGLAEWIKKISREKNIDTVVLSGGCFLNQVMAEGLIKTLSTYGITSLLPRKLPPNDGGISLGQAWIGGIKG
ncbi:MULTISPECIES: carbamoyltransferase HypF [Legionella]|uniref:Carbamoyltransferase HypF n=1 Tax=Legionella resiliens TaxID=2905958 RepID=A0ABS8X523_9GAMM|nr:MULTISPECIES: carbamoyltransferase HypF [unclassified Legionella]MCE0723217.1 carbamoyltransferase HypF [Legionella sp. 9fVS26]MCE3532370.1 carbamoyltransferase HypF [Legionella sp. 8cVS16]QLZ68510.1 Carbamoyltransferase HypF [Legionella sp. PC1000]